MHQLLQVIAVSLTVIASACVNMSVGDALLTLKGHLVMTEGRAVKCNLGLSPVREETPKPGAYYVRAIGANYSESFAVEPAVRDYRVTIACPGYETIERVVQSTRSITRIELGAITPILKK